MSGSWTAETRWRIRPVQPLWADAERVALGDDIQPGERVVVTDLSTPVAGLPLTTEISIGNGQGQAEPASGAVAASAEKTPTDDTDKAGGRP